MRLAGSEVTVGCNLWTHNAHTGELATATQLTVMAKLNTLWFIICIPARCEQQTSAANRLVSLHLVPHVAFPTAWLQPSTHLDRKDLVATCRQAAAAA